MKNHCFLCYSIDFVPLWIKGKYRIMMCNNCSFVFTVPLRSRKQMNKFYCTFDYSSSNEVESIIRKDAKRSLTYIEKYVRKKGKLLDVGCGRGYFLDEARKTGWRIYGIDYSDNLINYAKNTLLLNVQRGDMFHFRSKQRFDVVTLNQVIEHVFNPNDLIKKCYELLKPGGVIYVATPNIGSVAAKVARENFDHLIPPEHLGYFSKRTLSAVLQRNHFRALYLGSWSYAVDLAGILKRLIKGKRKIDVLPKRKNIVEIQHSSFIKKIKLLLFDKIFCKLFYRILNFDCWGTILEVVAVKV